MKTLFSQWNFIAILISYVTTYCIYGTLGSVVSPMAKHFGYESDWVSVFSAVFIFSGLIGSFVQAFFLDKYKRFLLQYRTITIGSLFGWGGIIGALVLGNDWVMTVIMTLFGFILLPIIAIGNSFAAT